MSKTNKNKNLTKMPISKLVFYMTFPQQGEYKTEDVEATLYKRLIKGYKFDRDSAVRLVECDQAKILSRGSDINNFWFGEDRHLVDIEEIVFENITVKYFILVSTQLTESEMLYMADLKQGYKRIYNRILCTTKGTQKYYVEYLINLLDQINSMGKRSPFQNKNSGKMMVLRSLIYTFLMAAKEFSMSQSKPILDSEFRLCDSLYKRFTR